jgi:thiamine pyrophosphokinase
MRACLIINSPYLSSAAAIEQCNSASLIVVADVAAHLLPEGVMPHVICGDFDSIDRQAAEQRFREAEFIHVACQESNDLEKCIKIAIERGAKELSIVGTLAGRLDQALTILSVIESYHRQLPIVFHDGGMSCRIVSSAEEQVSNCRFTVGKGDCISLIPRGDGATVSLSGVRWPLAAERLVAGSRGVSNEALETDVQLTVHSGVVFLVHGEGSSR